MKVKKQVHYKPLLTRRSWYSYENVSYEDRSLSTLWQQKLTQSTAKSWGLSVLRWPSHFLVFFFFLVSEGSNSSWPWRPWKTISCRGPFSFCLILWHASHQQMEFVQFIVKLCDLWNWYHLMSNLVNLKGSLGTAACDQTKTYNASACTHMQCLRSFYLHL